MTMLRKRSTPAFLASLLILSAAGAAEPGVQVRMRASSIDNLCRDLELAGRAMGFPGARAAVSNLVSKTFGPVAAAAIDAAKPVQVYVLDGNGADSGKSTSFMADPGTVFEAYLTGSPERLLAALQKAYTTHSKSGAIHKFSGMASADSGRSPDPLFLATVGDRLLTSDNEAAVRRVLSLPPDSPSAASMQDCAFTIDLNLAAWIPHLEEMVEGLPLPGAGGVSDDEQKPAGANTEMTAVLDAVRQMERLVVGLAAGSDALELRMRLRAAQGSALSGALRSVHSVPSKYASLAPADALLAIAGSDLFASNGMFSQMSAGSPLSGDLFSAPGARDSGRARCFSGDYCAAVVRRPEDGRLALLQVYGLSDPAAAKTLVTGMVDEWVSAAGTSSRGFTVVPQPPRQHAGTDVLRYACTAKPSGRQAAASALLDAFSPFGMELAFTASDMVVTFGPPTVMDRSLDMLARPGTSVSSSPHFARLFPDPPAERTKVFRLEAAQMLKALAAAVPDIGPAMIALIPDGTGGMAGYSRLDGGDVVSVTRAAYDELTALKGGALLIGALMARSMSAAGPTADAPRATKDARCEANLRRIDAAKDAYSLEKQLQEDDPVPASGLLPYLPGHKFPTCPEGGIYRIGSAGEAASCSLPEHQVTR